MYVSIDALGTYERVLKKRISYTDDSDLSRVTHHIPGYGCLLSITLSEHYNPKVIFRI